MTQSNVDIPTVTSDGHGPSFFEPKKIELEGDNLRMLSDRQSCLNFRLRTSDENYASGFHVAGDPTLLIVLAGKIKISLRSGESLTFSAGEMFIAEDYLIEGTEFDDSYHGHKAEVVGGTKLRALHLKLSAR